MILTKISQMIRFIKFSVKLSNMLFYHRAYINEKKQFVFAGTSRGRGYKNS